MHKSRIVRMNTKELLAQYGPRESMDYAIALLQARYGMDAHLAYAYLSAATDFNISQVVDLVTGVHARIRVSDVGG